MGERKLLRTYWVIREGKKRGEGRYWCAPIDRPCRIVRVRVYSRPRWTAEDERAAIVAWLRKERALYVDALIAEIERGEHMPKAGGK